MARPYINHTGQKHHRLSVLHFAERTRKGTFWKVRCDCGKEKTIDINSIVHGGVKSCGCKQRENPKLNPPRLRHGHARGNKRTPEYITWYSMIQRCTNPRHKHYFYYGGRGIKICRRWSHFENFLIDMGPRILGMTIDRIDNEKGYTPSNCRWASRADQRRNQRKIKKS